MQIAYVSQDEVNRSLAAGMIDNGSTIRLEREFAPPTASVGDVCVYDADHLPQQAIMQWLVDFAPMVPTAIHSFAFDAATVERLRTNGVLVFPRLERDLFESLARKFQRASASKQPVRKKL